MISQEWVAPHGWTHSPLRELAELNPPLGRQLSDQDEVRFAPMAAVDEEFGGIQRAQTRLYGQVKKGYTPFVRGDVIFAKITPCMENGKGGVVTGSDDVPYFGSTEFHVVRPHSGVLPGWIGHYLSQHSVRRSGRLNMKGSAGQLRVPEAFLAELSIPVAPLGDQQRVVDRLDELLTDLNAGVTALERVKKKLRRYRSAVLHAAVTGRLTAEWRKANGPPAETGKALLARILIERRKQWELDTQTRYAAIGKTPPSGWRQRYSEPEPAALVGLPEIPSTWTYATLDQVGDVVGGVAKNAKEAGRLGMRSVPYLRVANVQRGRLDLTEIKEISATEADIDVLRLVPGDVLFTEGGDRDKLGRGWVWCGELAECIHQNHVFRLRPVSAELTPDLISHAGNSYGQLWFQRSGKQSVNLASISLGVLRKFPVPIIPIDEQRVILDAVNEKLSQIESMEAEVERGLARAFRLKQSILRAAFEGKLVPQDALDEPASALLERIRAARAAAVKAGNLQRARSGGKRTAAR